MEDRYEGYFDPENGHTYDMTVTYDGEKRVYFRARCRELPVKVQAETLDDVMALMQSAIRLHLEREGK